MGLLTGLGYVQGFRSPNLDEFLSLSSGMLASLVAQSVKNPPAMQESACNAGDTGSIAGSGRSPGEGNGDPLWYSCLGNPMDRGAWQTTFHGVPRERQDLGTKPPRSWRLDEGCFLSSKKW